MSTAIIIPDLGVDEAEVVAINVKLGDSIELGQELLTLETDKASMEVPAEVAGVLTQFDIKIGQMLRSGDSIGQVEADAAGADADAAGATGPSVTDSTATPQPSAAGAPTPESASVEATAGVDVLLPDLGVDSAEVSEIYLQVGDKVESGQDLLALETDKASMEVPSTATGTIAAFHVKPGDQVSSGAVVATVLGAAAPASASGAAAQPPSQPSEQPAAAPAATTPAPAAAATPAPHPAPIANSSVYAGPAVRRLARELGVDLQLVPPTGARGRVVKQDVQNFVKHSLQGRGEVSRSSLPAASVDFSQFGPVESRPMGKIQRLTAEAMVASLSTAPQVTHHDQADITALEDFRKSSKDLAAAASVKLTLVPFLLKAVALALQRYPQFNVSLDGGQIVQKHYVHVGLAVDTEHGLFVPVIRDVATKSVFALAAEAAELAAKAQRKALKPAELQGGCFSISSLGALGGEYFTPIVNLPEAAILGVCRARIQPVYQAGAWQPRLLLPLSLSYDHRLINGADAARFTSYIAETLANPGFVMQ